MLMMNAWGNNIPSRHFRRWFYRCMGAKIGNSIIFRSTEILEPQKLRIGNEVSIGWHCLLDSRGGVHNKRQRKYIQLCKNHYSWT